MGGTGGRKGRGTLEKRRTVREIESPSTGVAPNGKELTKGGTLPLEKGGSEKTVPRGPNNHLCQTSLNQQ